MLRQGDPLGVIVVGWGEPGPVSKAQEGLLKLVLLNTYYCEMPTLRPPEAIWLFSTPCIGGSSADQWCARSAHAAGAGLAARGLHRQIGRLLALEDAIDIVGGALMLVDPAQPQPSDRTPPTPGRL
jgi:hypothetical protein